MPRPAIVLFTLGLVFCTGCGGAADPAGDPADAASEKENQVDQSKTRRDATLQYWKSFVELSVSYDRKFNKDSSGLEVAKAYGEMANKLDRLPLLHVDPELTALISKFSRDFRELSVVYGRISTRREDIGYGLTKIGESFLRGLTGDPVGSLSEDMAADREDHEKLQRVKEQLRANVAELSALRAKLTVHPDNRGGEA